MTWHYIGVTFSQVRTEVSSQNLCMSQIILYEMIWTIFMNTELNLSASGKFSLYRQ